MVSPYLQEKLQTEKRAYLALQSVTRPSGFNILLTPPQMAIVQSPETRNRVNPVNNNGGVMAYVRFTPSHKDIFIFILKFPYP